MTGRAVIGIDPGRKGAIALVEDGALVTVVDMPGTVPALQDAIRALLPVKVALLEAPFFPRLMGTKNVAASAMAYGELRATLVLLGVPVREIAPAKWKATLGATSDKGKCRRMAAEAFPDQAERFARVKDDGRADAALIALYAWEKLR